MLGRVNIVGHDIHNQGQKQNGSIFKHGKLV